MKTLIALLLVSATFGVQAVSTIDSTNRYAYGANIGWIDAKADTNNGAVIGEFVCSGYLYSGNVGWINLGNGSPTNLAQYKNVSSNDFGVNRDSAGNLSGYAYGANIGWIAFETNGAPKVNMTNGALSGSVYSANCGWISLSNSFAFVQTTSIPSGADSDGDGIPDAWEIQHAGNLTALSHNGDADNDGVSDYLEYLADTDPLSAGSSLRIIAQTFIKTGGNEDDFVTWTSQPTRNYKLQQSTNLFPGSWNTSAPLYSSADSTVTGEFTASPAATNRFFRVQALRPLAP